MRHIKLQLSENEFDNLLLLKEKAERIGQKIISWERFIFQSIVRGRYK